MRRVRLLREKGLEQAVQDILKSRARTRIYVYLIRNSGSRTEQIIYGTKLHPSTVRETLSKMYDQKLITRKKVKNDNIGKNPYLYYPISPMDLLKKHTQEMEERLNKLASITFSKKERKKYRPIRIKIFERADRT
jgi:predicted DNA-binding transcriptional regulator